CVSKKDDCVARLKSSEKKHNKSNIDDNNKIKKQTMQSFFSSLTLLIIDRGPITKPYSKTNDARINSLG
ncbi:TPA: hypothetical protein ACH268_002719, partial [Raoultella ornithinolytica]